jgi:prepilin-type N-terminal cleavage/methylation domain-containing protein/prepilin-type processing-associated H-X9-DG protein
MRRLSIMTKLNSTVYRGFTLIELIAVIAIVAVLIALIFPVLSSMRSRGEQAKCASHLKSISIAWGSYVADNSGRLPPAATGQGRWQEDYWTKSLWPYLGFSKAPDGSGADLVGTVAFCPGNKGEPLHRERFSALSYIPNGLVGGVYNSSGAIIPRLRAWPNGRSQVATTIGGIDKPSKTLLFASAEAGLVRSYMDANNPGPYMATHFNGGGNVLFADGHVELFKPDPKNQSAVIRLIFGEN